MLAFSARVGHQAGEGIASKGSGMALRMPRISIASALLAAAVGASYAYVELSLNRMGVSAAAIGLNAAMPALAWLLGSPLMPWALRRFDSRMLLVGLMLTAAVAALAFPLSSESAVWMGLRFLFGGGCGLAFRLIEYWIGAASSEEHRARNIGIYTAAFCGGAVAGGAVVPLVGLEGWPPALLIAGLSLPAAAILLLSPERPPVIESSPRQAWGGLVPVAFTAFLGALIYGLFESVPYTLMPVYVVRAGLGEDWAAWSASAFLLGLLVLAVPIGWAADRWGKVRVLLPCVMVALSIPAVLPAAMARPEVLLPAMAVWGGFAGSLYSVTLAMLADWFEGTELAAANAVFGTLYALGSLFGPPLLGATMDLLPRQGLMAASALLFLAQLGGTLGAGRVFGRRV